MEVNESQPAAGVGDRNPALIRRASNETHIRGIVVVVRRTRVISELNAGCVEAATLIRECNANKLVALVGPVSSYQVLVVVMDVAADENMLEVVNRVERAARGTELDADVEIRYVVHFPQVAHCSGATVPYL